MTALPRLLRAKTSIVWLILIAATLTSWWLGTEHGISNTKLATTLILMVAFVKVRLVVMHFMEVHDAPVPLRLILEVYCVVVCAVLVVMYLAG
jgi:hypothetical protein